MFVGNRANTLHIHGISARFRHVLVLVVLVVAVGSAVVSAATTPPLVLSVIVVVLAIAVLYSSSPSLSATVAIGVAVLAVVLLDGFLSERFEILVTVATTRVLPTINASTMAYSCLPSWRVSKKSPFLYAGATSVWFTSSFSSFMFDASKSKSFEMGSSGVSTGALLALLALLPLFYDSQQSSFPTVFMKRVSRLFS